MSSRRSKSKRSRRERSVSNERSSKSRRRDKERDSESRSSRPRRSSHSSKSKSSRSSSSSSKKRTREQTLSKSRSPKRRSRSRSKSRPRKRDKEEKVKKKRTSSDEESEEKKVEETKRLLLERRRKIDEWKAKQKEKQLEKVREIEKEKEREQLMAEKKVLLAKVKLANEERIERELLAEKDKQEEYRRIKKEREKKEKEEEEQEKRRLKAKQLAAGKKEAVDPLDAFMIDLNAARPQQKKPKKKSTKKKVEFSGRLAAKLKPIQLNVKAQETERLFNEEVYSDDDLEIPEETSWLDKMKQKKKEIKKVDHATMNYITFRKDFYIEPNDISAMTDVEVNDYRKTILGGVKIRGKRCPRPVKKWSQCGLPETVYLAIKKYKYKAPFPIQCQAIPCIMSGRDCIACAKTGSGKTLAFMLPMMRHILDQPALEPEDGPIGLMLSPTRELAIQIAAETKKFAKIAGLKVVCCYGGAAVAEQIADLKRGCEIIVGTPGRMIDMLSANAGRVTNLRRVTYLVLDEADRMFDMGFEPQIMTIVNNTRPDRQTVMFSATFPRQVESLAKQALTKPVEIIIGGRSVASGDVTQTVKIVKEEEKFRWLLKVLGENYMNGQIIIFVDRQEAVDRLFQELSEAGYRSLCLHGAMDQLDRDCTIQDFKNKVGGILIATSIAARGLDVKDLKLVINYTVPNHYEDYVHRVGRTGRAGTKGAAVTFITEEQERYAPDLLKALTASKQKNIPEGLKTMADRYHSRVKSGEVKAFRSDVRSSGSKGYKFDDAEASKKSEQKARESRVYGASADRYHAIERKEEEERLEHKRAEKEQMQRIQDMQSVEEVLDPISKQMAAAKKAAEAANKSIAQTAGKLAPAEIKARGQIAVRVALAAAAESENANNAKRANSEEAAKAIARMIDLQQQVKLLGKDATPEAIREALADKLHQAEVEINDYPQHARWKATHKSSLSHIQEFSDVAITTKGTYIPPGRKPGPGERKLYLLIEGRNLAEVRRAKADLFRLLEDAAANSRPDSSHYGKYSVV